MRSVKILLYAVNGLGLGHITRQLAIAKYIRRYTLLAGYESEILFLTTSEVDSLPYLYDFPAIKIPSKTLVKKGSLGVKSYRKMAKMLIWNSISSFSPDIFVVDTFPAGSLEELHDVMDFGMNKVFIYRSRKDHKKIWQQPILKAYDKILYINEAEGNIDQIEQNDKTVKIGTIVQRDRSEMLTKQQAKKYFGAESDQHIACILAGGGGDKSNQDFFGRLIKIIQDEKLKDWQFIIAAGPLYKGEEIHGANAKWFYRADISLYWNAFDFVISAGGFNSVNELIHAQIPTLFFAQDRLYDNQLKRIKLMKKRKLCELFSMENSDEQILNSILKISKSRRQQILKENLISFDLKNDANEAALQILSTYINPEKLEAAEELLDMHLLQLLSKKGLDERTVFKTILAFVQFHDRLNLIEDDAFIDFDEVNENTNHYLSKALELNYPKNYILPLIYQAIKSVDFTTNEDLLNFLDDQLENNYQPD
ncbi:MAG: hypothetical protein H6600_08235 [Flavobacteriales bacterium]|nr:hypothetical protein [Flavobacteriales bacterium]MCB9196400.1 hypothetical protein [Flavobacteriales bacterium]MCB9198432.1 hypothetical protein [Flavobacteriales bacterium]